MNSKKKKELNCEKCIYQTKELLLYNNDVLCKQCLDYEKRRKMLIESEKEFNLKK